MNDVGMKLYIRPFPKASQNLLSVLSAPTPLFKVTLTGLCLNKLTRVSFFVFRFISFNRMKAPWIQSMMIYFSLYPISTKC